MHEGDGPAAVVVVDDLVVVDVFAGEQLGVECDFFLVAGYDGLVGAGGEKVGGVLFGGLGEDFFRSVRDGWETWVEICCFGCVSSRSFRCRSPVFVPVDGQAVHGPVLLPKYSLLFSASLVVLAASSAGESVIFWSIKISHSGISVVPYF